MYEGDFVGRVLSVVDFVVVMRNGFVESCYDEELCVGFGGGELMLGRDVGRMDGIVSLVIVCLFGWLWEVWKGGERLCDLGYLGLKFLDVEFLVYCSLRGWGVYWGGGERWSVCIYLSGFLLEVCVCFFEFGGG